MARVLMMKSKNGSLKPLLFVYNGQKYIEESTYDKNNSLKNVLKYK